MPVEPQVSFIQLKEIGFEDAYDTYYLLLFTDTSYFKIGSNDGNDLVLRSRQVSEWHLILKLTNKKVQIIDKSSKYGTFVQFKFSTIPLLQDKSLSFEVEGVKMKAELERRCCFGLFSWSKYEEKVEDYNDFNMQMKRGSGIDLGEEKIEREESNIALEKSNQVISFKKKDESSSSRQLSIK